MNCKSTNVRGKCCPGPESLLLGPGWDGGSDLELKQRRQFTSQHPWEIPGGTCQADWSTCIQGSGGAKPCTAPQGQDGSAQKGSHPSAHLPIPANLLSSPSFTPSVPSSDFQEQQNLRQDQIGVSGRKLSRRERMVWSTRSPRLAGEGREKVPESWPE